MYRRDIWWPNDEIPLIFPAYASLALSRLVFLKLNNKTMKKKCNVVQIKYSGHPHSYSHLYITSDDKIEVGDYYVDKADSSIEFCKERVEAVLAFRFNYCKVIASTDPSLNLPAIPSWFVKAYTREGGINEVEVIYECHTAYPVNEAGKVTPVGSTEEWVTKVNDKVEIVLGVMEKKLYKKTIWTEDEIKLVLHCLSYPCIAEREAWIEKIMEKFGSVEQDMKEFEED